jgi:RNA polymerase sigma factor (sigma-70 family)
MNSAKTHHARPTTRNTNTRKPIRLTADEAAEVDSYLASIPPYAPISPDEELAMITRAQAGDRDAWEEMVNRNLRLAISIACEYTGYGVPVLDLIQEGAIGLMNALGKYEPSYGTRFATYAYSDIHFACQRAVANMGSMIRVPVYVHSAEQRVRYAERANERASDLEILRAANITPTQLDLVRAARKTRTASLDEEISKRYTRENGHVTIADTVVDPHADTEETATSSLRVDEMMQAMTRVLTPRERIVLELLYGLGERNGEEMPVGEIARKLGISRNTVTNCHKRAKAKLRAALDGPHVNQTAVKQQAA